MPGPKIPVGPDQITDSWLTQALRRGGTLSHATVSGHSAEPLKVGIGSATIVRVTLEYDAWEEGAPPSLVAKFRSPRETAEDNETATFLREPEFYRHFGAGPEIPVPICYHAEAGELPGAFVLLLEDMSDCRVGTLDGRPEDIELAVGHLALFHARWWNSGVTRDTPWLRHVLEPGRGQSMTQVWNQLRRALLRVRRTFGKRLPQTCDAAAERLLSHNLVSSVHAPLTLIHGDYHPAQMFFPLDEPVDRPVDRPVNGPAESAGRFAVIDWEAVHVGNGGEDLARIIALGLTTEQREHGEERLVRLYHEILREHGVTGYGLDRCWLDFRRGLLYSVILNVISGAGIDPSLFQEAREDVVEFIVEIIFGRLEAALIAHDILELLPP